jgi:uncharacterized protein (TIGR00369 family)
MLPPAARRSQPEQQRFEAALKDLFEHRIAFNEVLGFRITSFDPVAPAVRFAMRPELVGHYTYGRLHGGVISAVLDATAGFALMLAVGEKFCAETTEQVMHRFGRMGTVDLRVDYLHPGVGQHFDASAKVTRLGGRIASTQMALSSDDGTLVATGAASYVVS